MSGPVDIYLVYEFLKRLTTPFEDTRAFKLKLIDKDGNRLKKAETPSEKSALGYYDRLVFNLKRLLAKVPGGNSKIATFAAALILLKEQNEKFDDEKYLEEALHAEISKVHIEECNYIMEDFGGAANSVGSGGVAGLDNNPPVRRRGRSPVMGMLSHSWSMRIARGARKNHRKRKGKSD